MASDDRLRRVLYGIRRQFGDRPARSGQGDNTVYAALGDWPNRQDRKAD
jgi:hypothetical protein